MKALSGRDFARLVERRGCDYCCLSPPLARFGPKPVHVIFYRALQSGVFEIVRLPHNRMEPRRHIGAKWEEKRGRANC